MTTTLDSLHAQLAKPFPSKSIAWRVGSTNTEKTRGTALPYMTPRAIQDRLDEAVGPGGWEAKYRVVETEVASRKMAAMFCAISLYLDGKWVTKEDAVEISANGESGRGHIDPVKTAVSDAFKRAAVLWGLGRYLYEFEAPWVALKEGGKHFATQPCLPAHMLPEGDTGAAPPAPAQAPAEPEPAEKISASAKPTRTAPAAKAAPAPAPAAESLAASVDTPAPAAAVPAEPAVAAEPAAAAAPAPEAGEPATAGGTGGVLDQLQGTALETAKNVLERARTGKAPISLLRNYLKGDSAKKLFSPEAITGLGTELDTIEASARAVV